MKRLATILTALAMAVALGPLDGVEAQRISKCGKGQGLYVGHETEEQISFDTGCGTPNYVTALDGADQYWSHVQHADFDITTEHAVIVVCGRLTATTEGSAALISQYGPTLPQRSMLLQKEVAEVTRVGAQDTLATRFDVTGTWAADDTNFHCVALKVDPGATDVEAWMDGSGSGSAFAYDGTVNTPTTEPLIIGGLSWAGAPIQLLAGEIDTAALWITAAEVVTDAELDAMTVTPSAAKSCADWDATAGIASNLCWEFSLACDGAATNGDRSLTNNNEATCVVR